MKCLLPSKSWRALVWCGCSCAACHGHCSSAVLCNFVYRVFCFKTFIWRPAWRGLPAAAVIYQPALMCFSRGFSASGKAPQSQPNPGGRSALMHQGCVVVNHHSLNTFCNHPCWGRCCGREFGWRPRCQLGLSQFQSQSAQRLTSGQSLDWVPNGALSSSPRNELWGKKKRRASLEIHLCSTPSDESGDFLI